MTAVLQEFSRAGLDVYYQPLQEERILPVQLPKTSQPHWTRVMLSLVLEQAIADVIQVIPNKKGNVFNNARRFQREAIAWIASDERSLSYLTFLDTCDHLGLNGEDIRKAIAKPGFVLRTEWRINLENQARARNQRMG